MTLTCTLCNTEFTCGADTQDGCWCDQLPNIMPVEGGSFYCPKCLEERIKEKETETGANQGKVSPEANSGDALNEDA